MVRRSKEPLSQGFSRATRRGGLVIRSRTRVHRSSSRKIPSLIEKTEPIWERFVQFLMAYWMGMLIVRLPEDMLAEIDGLLKQRRVKVARNTWFLEAIVEKIQHEKG